ncbi:alpha-D-ribose 1-methylphosphonate 5-phosphate C-P-lyase PhnJ [Desulfocicer niacini]
MIFPSSPACLDVRSIKKNRRAILKAVAVPGYQVPFVVGEIGLPRGWGTGAIQITASLLGKNDTLKVIDQGDDNTLNALGIKDFFKKTAAVCTTEKTSHATIIQTRHRIPETGLSKNQIVVYQVSCPEPLQRIEPDRCRAARMHAFQEYESMYVKLYEEIVRNNAMDFSFDHPVRVNNHYMMSPSPIPPWDNAKLDQSPALHLFGAGREKRVYAVPPFTRVKSLDFEDFPFKAKTWTGACAICGASNSFLCETLFKTNGSTCQICSDREYCRNNNQSPEPCRTLV